MNKRLQALLKRKAAAVEQMKTLTAQAGDADLNAEQLTAFNAAQADAQSAQASIEQVQAMIEAERTLVLPEGTQVLATTDNRAADPTHGFAHFGQYLAAVRHAAIKPGATDQRLNIGAAATTYANESTGADGGFLVPPQYSSELMSVIEEQDTLLSRVRNIPVTGSEFKFPASEKTAHGSTGIQAYWDSEGDAITATKPVFKNGSIKLDRLTALAPVTEEALEDSAALGSWIQMEAGETMAFKISDAIYAGTGSGQPLGILNAPCLVTVTKESSQVAATVVAENVLKMKARMPQRNFARAVWLAHSDVEVQLAQMNFKIKNVAGSENVGGVPVFYPPSGLSTTPYSTLMGRPIVFIESAAALGTVGDLVLADLSQYVAITKGGVKADQSMHFYFDQNVRAFRFVFRMGGQPWLSAAISRKNGSSTQSHFVALQTRS